MKIITASIGQDQNIDIKEDTVILISHPAEPSLSTNKRDVNEGHSGKVLNSQLDITLNSKGTKAYLTYADIIEDQNLVLNINVKHKAENTKSHIMTRVLLKNGSDAKFEASLNMAETANNAHGYLDIKSMASGQNVGWEAQPQLQVENKSAEAIHKARLVDFNQDQVFYLEKRGLSSEEAKEILLNAFFNECLTNIPDKSGQDMAKEIMKLNLERAV